MSISNVSKKAINQVILESTIVGLLLIGIIKLVNDYLLKYIPNITGNKNIELLFVSGFLFHIICEYTGVNIWYSKEYCKLL
jgi:hypothetical protein